MTGLTLDTMVCVGKLMQKQETGVFAIMSTCSFENMSSASCNTFSCNYMSNYLVASLRERERKREFSHSR